MKFTATPLGGVFLIEPTVFKDARGAFFESYRQDEFAARGLCADFPQDNHSVSKKGTLRGLHYQLPPFAQAKLVRVMAGSAFDVALDLRKNSPTFGRYFSVTLDAANHRMLYIPAGFAHGFLTLEDGTEFLYKAGAYYSREAERGVAWDDPALGIDWPKIAGGYLLSDKDRSYPKLAQAETFEGGVDGK